MEKRGYTLIKQYNERTGQTGYILHRTGYPHLGVMGSGVGHFEKEEAVKAARKFCKQVRAKLIIKC